MTKYLNKPVAYLQDSDFNDSGNLVNTDIPRNKHVLIMIQAMFCGYCTQAKPAFQEFANKNSNKVFCATICPDGGEPGEKELNNKLDKIDPTFKGFPSYVLFVNGKYVKTHNGGRSVNDLENFI